MLDFSSPVTVNFLSLFSFKMLRVPSEYLLHINIKYYSADHVRTSADIDCGAGSGFLCLYNECIIRTMTSVVR